MLIVSNMVSLNKYMMIFMIRKARLLLRRILNKIHDYYYLIINGVCGTNVEFYLVDSFEIFHFLPLYNAFKSIGVSTRFVLEKPLYNTSGKWFDFKEAKRILKEKRIRYRKGCNTRASIVFSTQRSNLLNKYNKAKKISVSYGLGLNIDNFGLSKETCLGFDYRFIHGEFMQLIQSKYMRKDNLIIMGFPKHNGKIIYDKCGLKKELNIKTKKEVLVYFPTWDEDCSVDALYSKFVELKKKYYIVTKMHHCLDRLKSCADKKRKIYEFSDLVLKGNYDFAKSTFLGDVAIIDAKSGAATEVPFINNKIKMTLFTVRKNYNDFYDELRHISFITNNPNDIDALIDREFDYKERKKIIDYLYSNVDDDDLEEIANRLINKHTNTNI